MLKRSGKSELNQISLTGLRALVILGLLVVMPRSLAEIREKLISYNVMDEDQSDDILRIDMNTLKEIGCEISRADIKNGGKYYLLKHPFSLKVSEEEIKNLKKVYRLIKNKANISQMLEYDELFRKLASYIYDEENREKFLGILAFKHYDLNKLKKYIEDCENNLVLDLLYESPLSKKCLRKQFLPQELVFRSDKLYLHGVDIQLQKEAVLKVSRIATVYSRTAQNVKFERNKFEVKFKLKSFKNEPKPDNEHILEIKNGEYTVLGSYHNSFYAMQRMLFYGSDCVVLEPQHFRENVIKRLKEIRDVYGV